MQAFLSVFNIENMDIMMIKYAEVSTNGHTTMIPLEITNFGEPYKDLFDKAIASGYGVWRAYSFNGFDNPFQKAD